MNVKIQKGDIVQVTIESGSDNAGCLLTVIDTSELFVDGFVILPNHDIIVLSIPITDVAFIGKATIRNISDLFISNVTDVTIRS